jgi:hypothetical protein
MLRDSGHNWLGRGIVDFAVAMALFWAVAFYVHGDHNRAHAVAAPRIGTETILNRAANPAPARWQAAIATEAGRKSEAERQHALVLLSVAFAAIMALNLGFLRHLRRVYASPRRSVWRRGR